MKHHLLWAATALALGSGDKLSAQTFPDSIPFHIGQVGPQTMVRPPYTHPVDLLSNTAARRIERARAWSAYRSKHPSYSLEAFEEDKQSSTPPNNFIFNPSDGEWFLQQPLEP